MSESHAGKVNWAKAYGELSEHAAYLERRLDALLTEQDALREAATKVVERAEERLIGTRLYTVPWADVHNLREVLALPTPKQQEDER